MGERQTYRQRQIETQRHACQQTGRILLLALSKIQTS